ncbi:hypothetical protein [Dictyobacter kobayashii]|uniref:Uncharacterized protein n=1 Tax=Dictyobacter kobayashii TaxID=2014872 RepID=A0A402ATF7_9CHLR|nr:hypothetical protein [Dictyobacter kobayashii]GCE22355.1 hypothetical protein KDK_61550 [Dictyobacter kobayashii]
MTAVPNRTYTTLSSRGLRHDILPMKLYHKAKKLGTWDPARLISLRIGWIGSRCQLKGRRRFGVA